MSRTKSPAYQWYPSDYLADEHVQQMTLEAEGAYRRLLDHQWLNGSIPAEIKALAKICRKLPAGRMRKLWEMIAPCFVPADDNPLALVNRRMERVRAERVAFTEERSASGRKGGLQRAANESGRDRGNIGEASGPRPGGGESRKESASFSTRSQFNNGGGRENEWTLAARTIERETVERGDLDQRSAPLPAGDTIKLSLGSGQAHPKPPSPSPSPSNSIMDGAQSAPPLTDVRGAPLSGRESLSEATAGMPGIGDVPASGEPNEFLGWFQLLEATIQAHGGRPAWFDERQQRGAYVRQRAAGVSHDELVAGAILGMPAGPEGAA